MTFQINIDSIASTPTILTGNTVTDLVQATRGNMTIAFIEVCNLHNAAVTVTLERYDGTTSHYLTYAKSVAANDTLTVPGTVLPNNHKLRATSGNASGLLHIHVHHTLGAKVGGGASGH